jgi:hypothetical protein
MTNIKCILNAFSFNMVSSFPATINAAAVSQELAQELAQGVPSAVGHPDTARVFEEVLGCPVPANRANVALTTGDVVLVGQYRGPRLPEGATELPEGAAIEWLRVSIQ